MIENYPNPEQIWFIRDLLHKAGSSNNNLTDEEKELAKTLRLLIGGVERQFNDINQIVDEAFDPEIVAKLKEELNPFVRKGVIYMGSGYFGEYGCNRLHEALHNALSIISGLQQGGLMGTDPDSPEYIDEQRQEIRGIISGIAEKLGEPVIFKENPQNEEPTS